MTYRTLLEALNSLSGEQLDMTAIIVTPDKEFVEIEDLWLLEEYMAKHQDDFSDVLELDQPIMEVSL